ncbi:MAG TPA: hypothetical protein VGB83_00275 [Actinomycetota bacterium]
MRRIIAAAVIAAAAFGFAGAHAEAGNGCVIDDGAAEDVGFSCTYTAAAEEASYAGLTPNSWRIYYVTDEGVEVELASSGNIAESFTMVYNGTIATPVGEDIIVELGPDDAEVVTGSVGTIGVAETA